MLSLLLSGLVTALSLLVVDLIVPGVELETVTAAAIAAVSIGVVNTIIKPVLAVLAIPATILTLGFFALVVNGFCFWLSSTVVPGFYVRGVLGFILGPIVLSLVSTLLSRYLVNRYPEVAEGE